MCCQSDLSVCLEVSSDTSVCSGCSCVYRTFNIFNIRLYSMQCKLVPFYDYDTYHRLCFIQLDLYSFFFFSLVHVTTNVPALLLNELVQCCGCVSYQIFSPVIHIHVQHCLSPLQLLSSRGMTQFLFIIIEHSLPAWIDYTHATLCPQFNSRQEECNITAAQSQRRKTLVVLQLLCAHWCAEWKTSSIL